MNQQDWLELTDRVCVVTGAAGGIGAAIAEQACRVGARVALLDRDEAAAQTVAAQLRETGGQAIAIACDASDADSIARAAQAVERELGPCTALVNNAGILRAGALKDIDIDQWNEIIGINLTGYLLTARAFAEPMQKAGGGSMVHIASIASRHPQSQSGAYSASKAGILLLSQQIAVEWAEQGIRSNTISPGMIRTKLSAPFYAVPGIEAARSAMTASRRVGEPLDIANAAMFLLSPRSAYVNASDVRVDGGMSAMLMDMVPRPGYNAPAAATN
ncbi:MAG: glucose 1-dehydrogenase [Alcaligenaceae bacterium]|nr:glucose 1-dehydrogenase [Alcaligenaceae bacterium]